MKTKKINVAALMALFILLITFNACQKSDNLVPSESSSDSNNDFDDNGSSTSALRVAPVVPAILEVPAGNKLFFHVFATGVQIYVDSLTATGYAWVFKAPEATLYLPSNLCHSVGIHYAGPTWANNHGGSVLGAKLQSSPSPDVTAVPWLLLQKVSTAGTGRITEVTYIQRLNTSGGLAPTTVADAAHAGEIARIPYTAEYFFYHAE
jgi:hypothetical protein